MKYIDINTIVNKLSEDDEYMFDYEVEFCKYPEIVDKINKSDRDEIFSGMLEDINTWDIRNNKDLSRSVLISIIKIAKRL